MKKLKQTSNLKALALMATTAFSGGTHAANLSNGDFSAGFSSWQGNTTTSSTISSLPGAATANFDASSGAAILSSSFDSDGSEYSVFLYQTFDLSSNALSLSFDYSWQADGLTDNWLAQLIDTSDANHTANLTLGSGNGQFDLSGFAGLTVQLLFGLENFEGVDDRLSIDNITIAERQPNGSVPEPSSVLLLATGLLASRCKKFRHPA